MNEGVTGSSKWRERSSRSLLHVAEAIKVWLGRSADNSPLDKKGTQILRVVPDLALEVRLIPGRVSARPDVAEEQRQKLALMSVHLLYVYCLDCSAARDIDCFAGDPASIV